MAGHARLAAGSLLRVAARLSGESRPGMEKHKAAEHEAGS